MPDREECVGEDNVNWWRKRPAMQGVGGRIHSPSPVPEALCDVSQVTQHLWASVKKGMRERIDLRWEYIPLLSR